MAFNNWPYTNFQDLNLNWILNTYKNALNKALEALGKATAVEATVGTYTDSINAATLTANQASATANQAMELAETANELLYIFDHGESKAQNFVKYVEGETVFVSATDIFTAITGNHKLPVFMDRNNYIYDMAGFETNPENPLEVTRFRFVRDGGDRQYIVWIDRSANITYTTVYSGGGTLDVNCTSLQSTGQTSCDKTYAEVNQAYNSGMTVRCHVVDEIHHVEYYAYDCEFIENDETGDYFRWCSPYLSAISGFYKPFLREDELCNIITSTISGGGSADAVLYTAQTLTSAQKTQARSNIGAGKSSVSVNNNIMTIVDEASGNQNAYPLGGSSVIPVIEVDDTSVQMGIDPGKLYIFNSAVQLTVTPVNAVTGVLNEYHFLFYSGATATTLTLPNTIRQPDGFTVEANHWYEVSILEDNMLAYGWAVSA